MVTVTLAHSRLAMDSGLLSRVSPANNRCC
uniref:Uncharacterized protein n=1 Tax=Anguilla anguilla TaxID=7936 RepID=A0A0E9QJE9_ANGAN